MTLLNSVFGWEQLPVLRNCSLEIYTKKKQKNMYPFLVHFVSVVLCLVPNIYVKFFIHPTFSVFSLTLWLFYDCYIIIKVPRRIWIKSTCSKPNMNDLLSRSILCYKERTTGKRVRTINLMLDIVPILSVYNLCIFEIHCDFANKCKYVDITNNSHRVKLNRMFLI